MQLDIGSSKKVFLEAISILYPSKQIIAQWLNMEQTGADWNLIPNQNSKVGEAVGEAGFDDFLTKSEADKIALVTTFITAQEAELVAPEVEVNSSLSISISPLDGVTRTVQVYDMKINYSEKWVRIYTRCVYGDDRPPKYVEMFADNSTLLPDGQGGTIGEYDYLYYRIYVTKESLVDLQTEEIQFRSTPDGGAKWD